MADTKTVDERHAAALERIATALGTTAIELTAEARNDPPLARAMTLENIADALDKSKSKPVKGAVAPVEETAPAQG